MSREQYGYLVWGIIALFVAVPELVAAFGKDIPFPTLSETVWNLSTRFWPWVSILILAGLSILIAHFVFHWPPDNPPWKVGT